MMTHDEREFLQEVYLAAAEEDEQTVFYCQVCDQEAPQNVCRAHPYAGVYEGVAYPGK